MSKLVEVPPVKTRREVLDQAVIRWRGRFGRRPWQITGNNSPYAALYGNDIATFSDYPAEIAPPREDPVSAASIALLVKRGLHPGDAIDVLIAMNPAALKVNIADLKANGI